MIIGRSTKTTSSSLFETNMSHDHPSDFEKKASKEFFRGNPDCNMCQGSCVVSEGEYDDIREVPCPCTIDEPADFSGSTEGDR